MSMVVRAFPVKGSIEDVKAFAEALGTTRRADASNFFRRFGVTHECWHLQDTPAGPWVIAVSVVDDPTESAPRFAASSAEFDAWFKEQVLRLSGVDQTQQPLGPPTTQLFAWSDDERAGASLSA